MERRVLVLLGRYINGHFIILLSQIELPSPLKIVVWIIGFGALIWTIYSFAVKVFNTSRFEKLFFSKSQLIVHNATSFVLEMLIFMFIIVSLSVMLHFSESPFNQNIEAILTISYFVSFAFIWLIIGCHTIKDIFTLVSKLKFKNKQINLLKFTIKDDLKFFYFAVFLLNIISGVLIYLIYVNRLISLILINGIQVLSFNENSIFYITLLLFILPFGMSIFYRFFIKSTFNKNNSKPTQYSIKKHDSNYINEKDLITYHSISKNTVILVRKEDNHKSDYLIENFFLYDFFK
ncbi:hypothetical protein H1D32_13115 [Anaerobacillus sp. CMMVII]|uniref:hypothetical protein n=1 Tax=Anaerobacillus sp. CMMVII TaxID=2755588 RepID=UPI0021B73955|nr:hypothetical protein [Anaerobacillus sp. CMMVII]MCT8138596.1 hypothetical protein [Anaerobacillus sp. CMMVII]